MVSLPTARVTVNGFLVSDALIDSGSQTSLIDSRIFSVVAPNSILTLPARLVSASGHDLNVLGTCRLKVKIVGTDEGTEASETAFVVS